MRSLLYLADSTGLSAYDTELLDFLLQVSILNLIDEANLLELSKVINSCLFKTLLSLQNFFFIAI